MSRKRHSSGDYKVYIGNLPRDASEREIEKAFRDFGPIKSVWVAQNPPGFAFVEYEDERDAADAIKDMDEATVCGARIRVRNGNDYVRPSRGPPRGAMGRRPFDPSDRCYRCNQKGHYAYDCDKYQAGSRNRRRSYSRSRSRDRRDSSRGRRRSYSRSYSRSRSRDNKRRSRTPSKSRDRRKSRSRSRSRS